MISAAIRSLRAALVGVFIVGGVSAAANAQEYPHATVTLVTHSRAGGGTDVFLRAMSGYLGAYLGTEFVVENVRGGSGAKAMARLALAPADGSIFYGTTPTFINTSLLSNPEYTYADLMGVVNIFRDPQVIYVRAASPHGSLTDVIDAARAKPGSVLLGVGSPGSLDRQAMERFRLGADIRAPVITHDGGGELLINVLNGTVTIGVGEIQELSAQIEAGTVRLIAVLTEERIDAFPEVPTARERGIDLVVNKFRGIAGPRGLPDEILMAWEKAVAKVLEDAEFQAWYTAQALVPMFLPYKEYAIFLDDFAEAQRAFFRDFGILDK